MNKEHAKMSLETVRWLGMKLDNLDIAVSYARHVLVSGKASPEEEEDICKQIEELENEFLSLEQKLEFEKKLLPQ